MTATPINLNKARKAKDKADARRQADENALRFGRSKSEKQDDTARAASAKRLLDGAKRET